MKKYLLFFCFLTSPFTLSAHLLKTYKEDMINAANKEKEKAVCQLRYAEDICPHIPNLQKKQHMLALISSSIEAVTIPDPKFKLLSIGLTLIGSLAQDMYEDYYEIRLHLAQAAHHFEMSNFYNNLSLHFPSCTSAKGCKEDEGSLAYLKAVNYFTYCDMLTICIEENWVRITISKQVTKFREFLLKELKNKQSKLTKKISEDVYAFSENLGEIMESCEDQDLILEIYRYIYAAYEEIEITENKWKIK